MVVVSEVPLAERQYRFVASTVNDRLTEHQAWPANVLKLEFEGIGIYQDRTGNILKRLLQENEVDRTEVEIGGSNIPFVTCPEDKSAAPTGEVLSTTEQLLDLFKHSSDFAELAAYVAFCKVYDEIGSHITAMEVLPKGERTHQLNGVTNELDGFMQMGDEYIPIEVYNGGDYLSTTSFGGVSDKYRQLQDYSNDEDPVSNPILVNRRADTDFKKSTRKELNGMVIDTDVILACEDSHPDLMDTVDLFNLNEIVHPLPPLETASGRELTGEDYNEVVTDDPSVIRPPSEMAEAAEDLPDKYLKRMRGGIQLFYVNTFYRNATERTEREASLVLQAIYNLLLREGGKSRQRALDEGWDEFIDSYRQTKSVVQRKEMIIDQTGKYISQLLTEKILTERNSKIHARKATHPQQTFTF